jgi:hypothetical protein
MPSPGLIAMQDNGLYLASQSRESGTQSGVAAMVQTAEIAVTDYQSG